MLVKVDYLKRTASYFNIVNKDPTTENWAHIVGSISGLTT